MCYNLIMLNKLSRIVIGIIGVTAIAIGTSQLFSIVFADETGNTNFQVNVVEALSVAITVPDNAATGNVNEFLRNRVQLSVSSNNAAGFTASMTTETSNTALAHESKQTFTIPTLASSSTRSSFPVNRWGYSLGTTPTGVSITYGETVNGNNSSNYYPLVGSGSTPITLLYSASATSGSQDIYFGAKADMTKASGTYNGTVVISVVSGAINNNTNPVTPTDPATPNDPSNPATNPSYDSTNNRTVYTTVSSTTGSNPTTTTTTQVTQGDTRSSYASPAGVQEYTASSINDSVPLATGLAVTATVAATTGLLFFVVAKRDEDDDEEENNNNIDEDL